MKLLVFLVLCVLAAVHSSWCGQCPAARVLSLAVTSRRNTTGHWTLSVVSAREDALSSAGSLPPRELAVEVGLNHAVCQTSETTTLQASTSFGGGDRKPPLGYEVINGLGYYKMIASALTWREGRDKCRQEGADLIVVNSEQEADVVRAFINRNVNIPNASLQGYTFLGVHDHDAEGKFITVHGEPLENSGYVKWWSGEPNGGTSENCVRVEKDIKFIDYTCSAKYFIICEYTV